MYAQAALLLHTPGLAFCTTRVALAAPPSPVSIESYPRPVGDQFAVYVQSVMLHFSTSQNIQPTVASLPLVLYSVMLLVP